MKFRRILAILSIALACFAVAILGVDCKPKDQNRSAQQNQGNKEAVLNVFNWSNYIAPDTIANFEKEFKVKVNYDNYSSNDELLAKLQAGVKVYDVIVPSDYMVQIMIGHRLLEKLDFNNIPNFENISGMFKNLPFDIGNKYSIPYEWGTTGIGYNKAKITTPIDSWEVFWNEAYKGKITVLDDMREGLIPALKKSGYSLNTTSRAELEAVKKIMIAQKPLVKAYTSDMYMDHLKSEEIWIAHGYSGDIYQVAKEKPDIVYVIPKEGTSIWVDNMCIPKGAPHKELAEAFINYILRPEVGAAISNAMFYASPNEAAKQFIKPEILNNPNIYPPKEVLNRCEFMTDVGEETVIYERIFNQVKAE